MIREPWKNEIREPSELLEDSDVLWLAPIEPGAAERARAWLLGSSYGISLLVHLVALFLLSFVLFFTERVEQKAKLLVRKEAPRPKPFDESPPALEEKPEIKVQVESETPQINIEEELPEVERPKGKAEAHSNKDTSYDQAVDCFGTAGGGSAAFGDRFGKPGLVGNGGSTKTQRGVDLALDWLARHQNPDGSWSVHGWCRHCRDASCQGKDRDGNGSADDNREGVTALAILAFLGNGETHRFGIRHKPTVSRAMRRLRSRQKPDGSIGFHGTNPEWGMYQHAIATMALCEALTMTRDFRLKRPAQKAVSFCLRAQNPGQGWRYEPRCGNNDASVTGWMFLALKAARAAELEVPTTAFESAETFFKRVTDESSGETGYSRAGGGPSVLGMNKNVFRPLPSPTAAALLCRVFGGESAQRGALRRSRSLLMKHRPEWVEKDADGLSRVNFYYWYYGTYAMFQIGGSDWKAWNEDMIGALLPNQHHKSCARGSWDTKGEWSRVGGRVYATAINALTLEIYYRYKRGDSIKKAKAATVGH